MNATPILISFLSALAMSLALVPACRLVAVRAGYVAHPAEDRWHQRPTALLGGVAIVMTVFGCIALLGGVRQQAVLLTGGAAIFVVGLTDDLLTLKASTKLVAEIAIASALVMLGYRLEWVQSLTFDRLLTVLWIVGITNAFNLLDNMDGLCGGLALIAGGAFLLNLLPADARTPAFIEACYIAILLGAVGGFLVYNFNPAKIFMGDSGSLFIGFNFAALTLSSVQRGEGRSNLMAVVGVPVLVLLIPIFDTALVAISRLLSGRSVVAGGRDHSSHRLVAMGLSERRAVLLLWTLSAVAAAIGVGLRHRDVQWSGLAAAVFVVGMTLFAAYLMRVRVYHDDQTELRRRGLTPLVSDFMYKRRVLEVLLDFCLISIAYYTAYRLRFDNTTLVYNFSTFLQSLPLVLATQLIALFVVGAYRGVWRYFGLMDAVTFGKGVLLGSVMAQLVVLYLYRFRGYSRAVFAIYVAVIIPLLIGSRASFRLIDEYLHRSRRTGPRLVIYGAGRRGSLIVRELLSDRLAEYRVMGFIDDDPDKRQLRVHGYPVLGGYDKLVSLLSGGDVGAVVVSTRSIDPNRLQQLRALCGQIGVALSWLNFDIQEIVPVAETPEGSATVSHED